MRTAAGVVALLAVVLSVFTLTSLALTGRTVDAQVVQRVDQAWDRTYNFLWRGSRDAPAFTGRSPLDASGQPEGMLLFLTSGNQVHQAARLDANGNEVELSAPDVEKLAALVDETLRAQQAQDARVESLSEEEREGVFDVQMIRTLNLDEGQFFVHSEVVDDDGAAVVGLPTLAVDKTKANLARVQVLGSLAALVLGGLLCWWWIRRSLRPLGEVSQAAARVADVPMGSGEVSLAKYRVRRELAEPGNEVGDVGFALNQLIGSVDVAIEQRNRSEQRLRTFVADASHELRTPLAAVRGYAEMIRLTEPLTDRGQDALGRVLQQSDRMGSLVEDLLLLARLDAGREIRRGEVDLGELVMDAVMDATAAGRDHHWTVDVPEEPVTVLGDRQQLAQLVANLLGNARKHTPDGTTVLVRLQQEVADGVGTVRLTVQDDGPGIDPQLMPGLFDRFVRGDTARAAREGSTGLGLSIVRSVAHAHGGEATVESAPGRTVFTVALPASGSPEGPEAA
ncbi:sensor histidine kinase [Citricoccus zhacaiensis]|uniref:sensor histidine kinase n=1 Tax=Citricoccus zhacaiensis TaxID=489142 RepID=UPI003CE7F90D